MEELTDVFNLLGKQNDNLSKRKAELSEEDLKDLRYMAQKNVKAIETYIYQQLSKLPDNDIADSIYILTQLKNLSERYM